MKPIKIVQIGTGHDHASSIYGSLAMNKDMFDLVGLCEPVEEYKNRPLENATYKDARLLTLDEVLAMDDLEAVAIETGKEYSTRYALMCAERGLHIHLDKPGTADYASYDKLLRIMEDKNLVFHLGYMYRYNPLIRSCFDMIKEGKLGEIYSVEAQMSVRHNPEKRQWLERYKGGMMYFLGCHLIDLVYTLQGEPLEVLPMNQNIGSDGVTSEDFGFCVLRYPHGTSFVKTSGAEYNGYDRRQLVISGTRGTIELRPLEYPIVGGLRTLGKLTYEDYSPNPWKADFLELDSGTYNRYEAMMHGFASYIRGEKPNPCNFDYERGLMRLLLRCCGYPDPLK